MVRTQSKQLAIAAIAAVVLVGAMASARADERAVVDGAGNGGEAGASVGATSALPGGTAPPTPAVSGQVNPWAFSVRQDVGRMATPRALAVVGAGAILAAGALAVEDADAQARTFDRYGNVPEIGNAYGSWPAMLGGTVALTAFGEVAGRPGVTAAGVDLGRAYVYSAVAVSALKVGFGRTRPNGDRFSFPSGHAAAAFAAAPVLARHFGPWVGGAAYAFGGATAIGRMADRKHYLSDVIFGAAVGYAIGDAVIGRSPRSNALSHLTIEADRVAFQVRF